MAGQAIAYLVYIAIINGFHVVGLVASVTNTRNVETFQCLLFVVEKRGNIVEDRDYSAVEMFRQHHDQDTALLVIELVQFIM